VNTFTVEVLSPYLNYHRPCHFPTEYQDKKGKIRKRYHYQDMMTPYEKFRSLPQAQDYLNQESLWKNWTHWPHNAAIMMPPNTSMRPGQNSFNQSTNLNRVPLDTLLINSLYASSCPDWKILYKPFPT